MALVCGDCGSTRREILVQFYGEEGGIEAYRCENCDATGALVHEVVGTPMVSDRPGHRMAGDRTRASSNGVATDGGRDEAVCDECGENEPVGDPAVDGYAVCESCFESAQLEGRR